jgi:hypothetical protein
MLLFFDKIIELLVEPFKSALTKYGLEKYSAYAGLILFGTVAIGYGLIKLTIYIWERMKAHNAIYDLHPYYTEEEVKNAINNFVATKCQNIPPTNESEPSKVFSHAVRQPLIPFFLNEAFQAADIHKFYFVLADSGMGKTTFLINLYLRYKRQLRNQKYKILIFPLGYPDIDEKIDKVENKGDTILLLDAFDEDTKAIANYEVRLSELAKKTVEFREIVITCRSQFFPNDEKEPYSTDLKLFGPKKGIHTFKKIYISPFAPADIKKYFNLRYGCIKKYFYKKYHRGQVLINTINDIWARPLILSYIEDLINKKKSYKSLNQIYGAIIEAWVSREADRYTGSQKENFVKYLNIFSIEFAAKIFREFKSNGSLSLSGDAITGFAEANNIALSELELKSRSLLNRDSKGNYKFSHKSFFEYFLALKVFHSGTTITDLDVLTFDRTTEFYTDLCIESQEFKVFWEKYDADGFFAFKDANQDTKRKHAKKVLLHENLFKFEDKLIGQFKVHQLVLDRDKLKNLTVLKIYRSHVTINSLKPLVSLINLKQLYIKNNDLKNLNGIELLSDVEEIDFSYNKIEVIPVSIYTLTKLRKLVLIGNLINTKDIEVMKTHLPSCTILY